MTRWEYMSHRPQNQDPSKTYDDVVIEGLNELGEEGWEVVGYINQSLMYLLKRPKPRRRPDPVMYPAGDER